MDATKFTLEDLTDLIKELEQNAINRGETTQEQIDREAKFMALVAPYIHMTEEELYKNVPHGCYEISGNGLVAMTGKGGLIMTILAMQKQMKGFENEIKKD